jgi:hypothetical protein
VVGTRAMVATKLENDKELLEITLLELRRLHGAITQSFDNLRGKALALLAGEVAIVTFLFSASDGKQKAFFHDQVPTYGIVFYGLGIALLGVAFLIFLYVISTVSWHQPPEEKDVANITDRFNHDPLKFLEYLKDEYIESINHCGKITSTKAIRFMWGVYSLSLGIFIILMLKYGGGIIKI